MPRFSAEQRKKLKAELLENDDDMDDDDVLKPSLLHPSNRNISQLSPQMNTVSKQEKVEESGRTFTQKEIEEQGQFSYLSLSNHMVALSLLPSSSNSKLFSNSHEECPGRN